MGEQTRDFDGILELLARLEGRWVDILVGPPMSDRDEAPAAVFRGTLGAVEMAAVGDERGVAFLPVYDGDPRQPNELVGAPGFHVDSSHHPTGVTTELGVAIVTKRVQIQVMPAEGMS